jgi:hypothetical protein
MPFDLLSPDIGVREKAGSSNDPRMTPIAVYTDKSMVTCSWFVNGVEQRKDFPISALIASRIFTQVNTEGDQTLITKWEVFEDGHMVQVYADHYHIIPKAPIDVSAPTMDDIIQSRLSGKDPVDAMTEEELKNKLIQAEIRGIKAGTITTAP